nr:MAG TPA: hypothetical protein [Caudoviricetes sp.]
MVHLLLQTLFINIYLLKIYFISFSIVGTVVGQYENQISYVKHRAVG